MGIFRIGNNQITRNVKYNIQTQMQQQDKFFQQISSNKRLLKPSDDPTAMQESLNLSQQKYRNEQYSENMNHAELWTNISVTALDNVSDTWKRVNEIAVGAADGTKSQADLLAMSEEVNQLLEHLTQVANTSSGGLYIFGGSQTERPPFKAKTDPETGNISGVFYQGNYQNRTLQITDSNQSKISTLGSNGGDPSKKGIFIDNNQDINVFNLLIDFRDRLSKNDVIGMSEPGNVLNKIQNANNNLIQAQVEMGSIQEVITLNKYQIMDQNANLSSFLSKIEDIDVAQVVLELNNSQNVYEAALASAGRIMKVSLLNYL